MNKKVIAVVIIVALIAGAVVLYMVKPEFLTGSVLGGKKIQVESVAKKGKKVKKVEKVVKKKVIKKGATDKVKAGIKGKTTGGSVNSGTEADPRSTGGTSSDAVDSTKIAPDSVPTI
ncbi:MAG: hypothetical protein AAB953_00950 [Patescibacteria group bacterium]